MSEARDEAQLREIWSLPQDCGRAACRKDHAANLEVKTVKPSLCAAH